LQFFRSDLIFPSSPHIFDISLFIRAQAGIVPLRDADQSRFDEILLVELPALRSMADPARSDLLTGEWELRWTNEKEVNFAVANSLFGLLWICTYQTIDVPGGQLVNVIEFEEGGELRVGSSITPDPTDGARLNFVFGECMLRWRDLRVPLPPVGWGWGKLLRLCRTPPLPVAATLLDRGCNA